MRNLSSAVISFRTHPQQVLHPEIPFRMLTSPEERAELLRKTGIDRTIFLIGVRFLENPVKPILYKRAYHRL